VLLRDDHFDAYAVASMVAVVVLDEVAYDLHLNVTSRPRTEHSKSNEGANGAGIKSAAEEVTTRNRSAYELHTD